MAKSMTIVESHSKDPNHRDVFVMGYHSDEPGVLQAWDTEPESGNSETQREVCMVAHSAKGARGPHASNTGGEPPALRPEGNQPGTGQAGASR